MRSYLSLIPITARVRRRQNRMTRICIILAVFLVTSVFSLAEMWTNSETEAMRQNHGDWHIVLQQVPEDVAVQITESAEVAFSARQEAINADEASASPDYTIDGKAVAVYGVEETYLAQMMGYSQEGVYPQSSTEVALSADAKALLGVQVGDPVTLHTPAGDQSYTVSGFYEDDSTFNEIIDGACVYMNRAAFDEVCSRNGITRNPSFYLRFRSERGLQKTIAALKQQYGLTNENIKENTGLLTTLGASTHQSVNGLYQMAAVCFVIILISGIFMISGCMNSNVAQRTQFFGMLRCIGASKEQIVRFVRLEALNWCKTAIPIGCALGTVICWILCLILRFLVKGEWVNMPLFAVSIRGIFSGAVVGVVTVLLAAHTPAKQAARVSPAAAVSGNADTGRYVAHASRIKRGSVETSLGIHHATGAKKNWFLMTGSFALTIVLFLVFAACLDLVHKLLPSGGLTSDISIVSQDDANDIDRNIAKEISEIPGVKNVFGTMSSLAQQVQINGEEQTVDLYSYGKSILDNAKTSVASGDLSKVYGDSRYALAVYSDRTHLQVGDKIQVFGEELEIACVLSDGIGSVSGAPVVVCSEETYMRLTGEQNYNMLGMILEKDISQDNVDQIFALADGYQIQDNREEKSTVSGSYWVFRLAAYGFLAIVSLITVLNIMNSVSMSVSARIKQYGAMRAVGMENRQITKMIAAEAMTYAVSGMAVGLALGLLFHYLIYVKIIIIHFGGTWEIPAAAMAVVALLVAGSCLLAVHAPVKRIRNLPITETINEL